MPGMTLIQRLISILLFMVVLLLGLSLVVIVANARSTVDDELETSVKTVIQLVTAALVSLPDDDEVRGELIDNFHQLETAHNLDIVLRNPASGMTLTSRETSLEATDLSAPAWFVSLVAPSSREYRQRMEFSRQAPLEVVVTADPTDEIEETWRESRSIFWLILGFTLLSLVMMVVIIRRSLAPLSQLSSALEEVAEGDYETQLDKPELPDLDRLTSQFNRLAAVLAEKERQNQQLLSSKLQVQESERRRLAQELHDDLGQSITAIKALAVAGGSQQSEVIVSICGQMYDSVRSLMHQLRPPLLDELGLSSALEKLVDDWNIAHEESFCALSVEGDLDGLDESVAVHLFRCVQEALNNVAKHASADRVEVRLLRTESTVELHIADDGCGFDESQTEVGGMGLVGLRERAEACGGSFSLVTQLGKGVSITIIIPSE